MTNLFIYCGGGFGREVAGVASRINKRQKRWERIRFLDDAAVEGPDFYRLDRALEEIGCDGMEAIIANGEPFVRQALLEKLHDRHISLATLIDESAVISDTATIGAGAVILPGCYVAPGARLGLNVAMIAGALVGHDTVIGDNCTLSGHVNLGGGCTVGDNSYIGMGVQVREMTRIGKGTVVGMGSIVFADLPDEVIALGNPCRAMRPNSSKRIFKCER